nr:hypothetical protein BaRGS_026246 [Batillaria attramentaria]
MHSQPVKSAPARRVHHHYTHRHHNHHYPSNTHNNNISLHAVSTDANSIINSDDMDRRRRRGESAGMAWADVLFLVVCVPHEIMSHVILHWGMATVSCKLSGFVEMMSALAAILNLILISIER